MTGLLSNLRNAAKSEVTGVHSLQPSLRPGLPPTRLAGNVLWQQRGSLCGSPTGAGKMRGAPH